MEEESTREASTCVYACMYVCHLSFSTSALYACLHILKFAYSTNTNTFTCILACKTHASINYICTLVNSEFILLALTGALHAASRQRCRQYTERHKGIGKLIVEEEKKHLAAVVVAVSGSGSAFAMLAILSARK